MKTFLKGEKNRVLILLLFSLLFILWARVVVNEIKLNTTQKNLTTLSARAECIKSFGWEIDYGSETKEKVMIPSEFDDVYKNYNKLQKMCGFDLARYKNRQVMRYTYLVLNPPFDEGGTFYVNILICDDALIGGDCMSREIDGIMLPLMRKNIDK